MSDFQYAFLLSIIISNCGFRLQRNLNQFNGSYGAEFRAIAKFASTIGWFFGKFLLICLFFREGFTWYDPIIIGLIDFILLVTLFDQIYKHIFKTLVADVFGKVLSLIGLCIAIICAIVFLLN